MKKALFISAIIAASVALTSCNDAETDLFDSPVTDTVNPGGTQDDYVSRLTFVWDAVEGVHQYGYTLAGPDGAKLRQGITKLTTITFDRLTPSTDYTLTVEAFGDNGQPTKRFVLTARTPDVVTLAAPDPESIVVDQGSGRVTITWDAVDNAASYECAVTDIDGEEIFSTVTPETSVEVIGLEDGSYTFSVKALSDDEAFLASAISTVSFTRGRQLIETVEGVYYSYYFDRELPATMLIYDDGTHIIQDFYGVKGYNLEFAINEDESVSILNYYYEWGIYKYVLTGLAEPDSYLIIYQDPDYCFYDEDEDGKAVYFGSYFGESTDFDYDSFSWDMPE